MTAKKLSIELSEDRLQIRRASLQAEHDLITGKLASVQDQRVGINQRLEVWRDCQSNEKRLLEEALDTEAISLPTIPEPFANIRLRLSAKIAAILTIEKLLAIWPAREAFITSQIIEATGELKVVEAEITRHERELVDVQNELAKLS